MSPSSISLRTLMPTEMQIQGCIPDRMLAYQQRCKTRAVCLTACWPDQPPLGKPTALYGNLLRCKAIAKAASGTIQLRSPLQASLHGLISRSHSWRALITLLGASSPACVGRRWRINGRWLAGVGLLPGCCPAGPSPQPQPAPARAALPRAS